MIGISFRSLLGAALCLSLGFAAACAPTGRAATKEDRLLTVPFHAQKTNQCAPASLAGVLEYWGRPTTPDDVAREVFSENAGGSLYIDMLRYARNRGLEAEAYRGSHADLRRRIDQGVPPILFVDYGMFNVRMGHFMVAVGYGDDGVFVNSGQEAGQFISNAELDGLWSKTNYWTVLVAPPEREKRP